MEQMTLWQEIALIIGSLGGFEFVKWLFNRNTEKRINDLEVKQKGFELDERRIEELHASIDKANELNDNLLERLSNTNAALDKQIDRNRELSDRLYKSEQEINRVNDLLTEEQRKTADYEKRLGDAYRLIDHFRNWRCEKSDCILRQPPNPTIMGKDYSMPETEN